MPFLKLQNLLASVCAVVEKHLKVKWYVCRLQSSAIFLLKTEAAINLWVLGYFSEHWICRTFPKGARIVRHSCQIWSHSVGSKSKREISKQVLQENKARQTFLKKEHFLPPDSLLNYCRRLFFLTGQDVLPNGTTIYTYQIQVNGSNKSYSYRNHGHKLFLLKRALL